MKQRVGISWERIGVIAANTFTEAVRQKVFNVLLLVALALIASGLFFRQFSFSEQFKFVKDTGLGFMAFFGSLIGIVTAAQMLFSELDKRTVYTVLAKPVRRLEFVVGKYAGCLLLVLVSLLMMSIMFAAELVIIERGALDELRVAGPQTPGMTADDAVSAIHAQVRDPDLVKAVLLIFVKVAVLTSFTLLFATFSTSMVFNVTMGFMIWIAGTLVEPVREMFAQNTIMLVLLAALPDLAVFNVADDIVQGLSIGWQPTATIAVYGFGRALLTLAAAYVIFSQREL